MTSSDNTGRYPDIRWGQITAAMPAADGYPAENMLDDNPSTFYLSAETPPEGAEIVITLGARFEMRQVLLELGDGAGNYLWPEFDVWSRADESAPWDKFGQVAAGVERVDLRPEHPATTQALRLVVTQTGTDPVAVRILDVATASNIPTVVTTTPNPLPVSTFDELQYGRLQVSVGPLESGRHSYCTGIAIRIPLGRHAEALTDSLPTAQSSVFAGTNGARWTPLDPDLSDPDLAVFRFVPDGPDPFEGGRQVEFTVSGFDTNGVPGTVPIGVDQVVSPTSISGSYFLSRSRYEITKAPNDYLHSFRPASTVLDYNQCATLLWNSAPLTQYTISYRDDSGIEQTAAASGGSWTSPRLRDATNFTLTAARGGHVRHLTTHLEVGRKELLFVNFTAIESVTVKEKIDNWWGSEVTIASPVVITRDVTVEGSITAGSAGVGGVLAVTGPHGLQAEQIYPAGAVEIVGRLDARQGIPGIHGTPQVFAMRNDIEQPFTPPTDGYVMVSVTRQPGATGEARIGSEGATVWASPPTASGEPSIRSAILPVRKGNATTVKYEGSGSSSATLMWIPLGTGTISGVG